MSESGDRYGVRIRPPDGLTPDAIGELALMIAPITGQSASELEDELSQGSVVVARELGLAEAKQLVAVFGSLGANAELVEPDTEPGRQLFDPDESVDDAWRGIRTTGPPESPATLPFDVTNMRVVLAAEMDEDTQDLSGTVDDPRIKKTQPFDASVIQAALSGPAPASTQPLELGQLGPTLEPLEGDHFAATQQIDGEALQKAVQAAGESTRTQPFDARMLHASLAANQSTDELPDLATAPFRREALLGPPPKVVEDVEAVKWGSRATDPFDPGDEPATQERPTERLDIDPITRPRPAVSIDPETRPHGIDKLISTREMGATHLDGATRPQGAYSAPKTEATTAKFDRAAEDPMRQTGDMGSVQGGPLIFKLEAPPPQVTETGSVPRQVRLGDVTGEVPRVPPESRSELRPSGALPIFDLEAEMHPPRPDVFRLGEGSAETSRVVSITPPPTGEHRAVEEALRKATEPASPANSGSFQVMGADGQPGYLAPPRPASSSRPVAAMPTHSAGLAGMLGLVLPGMGQVYNGERDRAVWFAIGAVLIVPWVWGIIDAVAVAGRIAGGQQRPPDPSARESAVRGHLLLNMSILFGVVVGVFLWQRIGDRAVPPPPPPEPAPVAVVVDAAIPDAAPDTGPSPQELRAKVDGLMKRGRQACSRGLYAECEEIMHGILKLDRTYRAARSLLVEAVSKRRRREKKARTDAGAAPNTP